MRVALLKKIYMPSLVFALVVSTGVFGIWHRYTHGIASVQETTVVYTNAGFAPPDIHISIGQRVVFQNKSTREFWPASDLHPTHTLYPEFDTKQALKPGQQWEFVFSKIGNWRYHDHLSSDLRGIVRVGDRPTSSLGKPVQCVSGAAEARSCWNENIVLLLDTEGVSSALQYVGDLYKADSTFATDCHDYLHKIGEAVYDKHIQLPSTLGPETSYCGYGFFHGYMQRVLTVSGDIAQAATFCDAVAKTATQTTVDACYHGFGHGLFASSAEQPNNFGKMNEQLEEALAGCERMAGGPGEQSARCASGVFMELGVDASANKYGLTIDPEQPLAVCALQSILYAPDCYRQMQVVILGLVQGNIRKGARFSEAIQNADLAATSLETYMGGATKLDSAGIDASVQACSTIKLSLRSSCYNGISLAYLLRGTPGREGEEALQFCQGAAVPSSYRSRCNTYVLQYAKSAYDASRVRALCDITSLKEQAVCMLK